MMKFLARLLLIILGYAIVASPANAQITRTLTNTTTGAINSSTACGTPLVRNFTVTSNFIIGDVDLGFLATHTWRGDISITLQSPAGTRQVLVTGEPNVVEGDNLNVRLNNGGTLVVNSDNPAAAHSAGPVPPYQNNFIPDAPLSVFNGQTSAGTWRLEICDIFPSADDGTFQRSDLYLTPSTSSSGTGATFIVSSTADSGTATLRQAVVDANATPNEADTIAFNISGAGPHTITLASALPDITDNGVLIDGTTQSGTQCRDLWAGSGHDLRVNVRGNAGFDGFRLTAANQTVKGLSITGFAQAVRPASNGAVIQCNYLGLLANGTASANDRGVEVHGAGARIGGLSAGQGNVISANNIAGIVTTTGSTDTSIQGNFIGTDPTGMSARGNGGGINHFFGAATWRDITHNLIAANSYGIALEADDSISASTDQIRIQRNRIGFNRDLSALLLNGTNTTGIRLLPGSISNLLIGGVASTEGNEIAGSRDGIVLQGVSNIRIRGNTIARSGSRGIWVEASSNIAIGGTAGTEGNRIGGNASDGIRLLASSSGITILGNLIQPLVITGGTFANGEHGIAIDGASNVVIGDGTASGRNVIGGNLMRGIQGSGTNSAITINGNYIGTDATGNVAVTNGQSASAATRDAISFDSSGTANNLAILNNIIGGYTGALIELWTSTTNGVTIQGNSIGVGANGTSQIVSNNSEDLIYIGGGTSHSNTLIGGSMAGQGNTIAFSSRSGIRMESTGSNLQMIGNTIRNNTRNGIYLTNSTRAAIISNQIFANGLLGIDLADNGVNTNDAGDGDGGANDHLNFPAITAVNVRGPNELAYNFALDVPSAASGYRVEFFANTSADSSGFGEGERYLGYIDIAHTGGVRTFTGTLATLQPVSIGDIISATTTRRTAGSAWDITSEFSAVATAAGTAQLAVTIDSEVFDPQPGNSFATPGNDMLLTTTVSNVGTGSTDADSIFAVIAIDNNHAFRNDVTPAFGGVVGFSTSAPTLTFTPGTDLRFSNGPTPPASLAQCTYTPAAGYDSQVRYVCLNPKGILPSDTANRQMQVQMRARIN